MLVFAAGVEVYCEQLPNAARDKHQWMLRHSNEVTTLVLGHSHNMYGIRPDLLGEGAFNLALECQTLRYDDYLLKHYPMKRLQTVILNYDYFMPWEDLEHMPNVSAWGIRYRLYMDCDIHPRLSWYGFEVMSIARAKESLKYLFKPFTKDWDTLGWGTSADIETRPEEWDNGERRATGNTYEDESLVELNEGYLRDIFTFCRQRHVRVILLNSPVNDTFRQYEGLRQLQVNARLLAKLQKDYPEVEYLDLEADKRFGDDDFYDADHLNHEGAEKLTLILRDYLGKK